MNKTKERYRTRISLVGLLVVMWICVATLSEGQVLPALPDTEAFNTCFPDTAGYRRITVGPVDRDYSDLQEAIDAATPGTVIEMDAGAVFYGGFVLPDKGGGDEWIILISSRMDLLPPETVRVMPEQPTGNIDFPLQRMAMPRIVTNNPGGIPTLKTEAFVHHYRLVGLEITADPAVAQSFGLIFFGESSAAQNSLEKVPHHLIADRCYIHGHDEGEIMKFGIRLDCALGAVIDSYLSQFHSIGFDAQAISCVNGPGPFKILNNYLEASGENILIGGGAPAIPGLVPGDMEIRQNYFYKPWSWRTGHPDFAGKHWTIKNLFELKTGRRILLEGNILENCWADLPIGQSGYAILLTVRTEGGQSPQADVSDITIRHNVIRRTGAGITLSGTDGPQSQRSSRILISNNLFDQIDGPLYGDQNIFGPNDGTFLKIGHPRDVWIDHNTVFQSGPVTWAYQVTDSFAFTNNIVLSFVSAGGYQGIYGPGQSQGTGTFAAYFPDVTDANRHFHANVLIGGDASKYSLFNSISRNDFPLSIDDVFFSDPANGPEAYHGYALDPVSPFYRAADDGSDLGVDFNRLDEAMTSSRQCDSLVSTTPQQESENRLSIFPNPAMDFIHVGTTSFREAAYTIFNALGWPVLTGTLSAASTGVDITTLPSGHYTMMISPSHARTMVRFVKI